MKITDKDNNILISEEANESVSVYLSNILNFYKQEMNKKDIEAVKRVSKLLWSKKDVFCGLW